MWCPVTVNRVIAESGLGILGGTFDPVHLGHTAVARLVGKQLGLAQVRLLPNAVPPHRPQPLATVSQRLEMLQIAVRDEPTLAVDDRETRRPGPSWMVDTLEELRGEIGARARLVLILGTDAFRDIHNWSRWQSVFELAQVAVVARPGFGVARPTGLSRSVVWRTGSADDLGALRNRPSRAVICLMEPVSSASATALRNTLERSEDELSGVPIELDPGVWEYVRRNRLYKTGTST